MDNNFYEELDRLFHPRSMAAVGVSDRFQNMGKGFLIGYTKHGFKGDLYAIHPTKTIKKFTTYPSLVDVPGPVDFAYVCVRADRVREVIEDCGKKGVPFASVFTSGFRESGTEEGARLEEEVIDAARRAGVRLIGPNCMGVHCPKSGMTIRGDMPVAEPGHISLISQSGGVAISAVMIGAERGIGLSKAISYGNESDLGPPEFLNYLARDPETKVICIYVEGTRRPEAFRAALVDAAARKPVIVLKGGVSSEGSRAVSSHTGALSGSAETWEAMIRQAGAISVGDVEEMMETSSLLTLSRPPKGKGVCLLTISGGFGVFGADQVHAAGFDLPELTDKTRSVIAENFDAPGTSNRNPIDLAANFFQPDYFEKLFTAIDQDPAVDCLVVLLAIEYITFVPSKAAKYAEIAANGVVEGLTHMTKPAYVAYYRTILEPVRQVHERSFIAAGYPVFSDLRTCLTAVERSMTLNKG